MEEGLGLESGLKKLSVHLSSPVQEQKDPVFLSFCGGGYRGLMPALMVEDLEAKLSQQHGYQVYLSQHINGVAGTSTGGILAMGLAVSHPLYPSYPKYEAKEFPSIYTENGKKIFSPTGIGSCWGVSGAKYGRKSLEALLETHFGEATLQEDVLKTEDGSSALHVFIPAYNITQSVPHYFQQGDALKIRDIVGASTAAPTYFSAKKIDGECFIDGGIFQNNPAARFALKMRRLYPTETIKMISLGTGEKRRNFDSLKDAGKINVATVVKVLMTASQQDADGMMGDISNVTYIRLQPVLEQASLDKTDSKTTEMLTNAAQKMIEDVQYSQAYNALSQVCARKKGDCERAIDTLVPGTEIRLETQPVLSGTLADLLMGKLSDCKQVLTSLTLVKCNIWDGENVVRTPHPQPPLTIQKISEALAGCSALQEIDLSQNRLGDGGLYVLQKLSQVRKITCQENGLTSAAYTNIKHLIFGVDGQGTGLRALDLRDNPVLSHSQTNPFSQKFEKDRGVTATWSNNNGTITFSTTCTLTLTQEVVP